MPRQNGLPSFTPGKNMNNTTSSILVLLTCMSMGQATLAQNLQPEAQQVLNLSASARKEAPQDWLSIVVRAQQEGNDPVALQNQLKATLETALASLRPRLQARQLEVRSGNFGIYPRHNNQGRVIGWQGQADLVVEGRDFALVSQLAGNLPRMTVSQADFSLSREGRQQLEAEVQSQAVQNFRQRAQALAKDFGFTGYTLRQVSVSAVDRPEPGIQPRVMMAEAAMAPAAAPTPIPLVAGKDEVRITVSGSIQLR